MKLIQYMIGSLSLLYIRVLNPQLRALSSLDEYACMLKNRILQSANKQEVSLCA
jgi:hypothetical protein